MSQVKLPATERAEAFELAIMDEDKPDSLINIAPPALRVYLKKVPIELFALGEEAFIKKFEPDGETTRLKLRFWDEWQTCVLQREAMQVERIYGGVCTREFFLEAVKVPEKLAWIIMPPVEYEISLRETLYQGQRRLREIIQLPITTERPVKIGKKFVYDDNGKHVMEKVVNVAVVKEIRQTVALLSDRVKGSIAQRLEVQQKSTSLNLNVNATPAKPGELPTGLADDTMDALAILDAQLSQIDHRLKPFDTMDVEAEEIEATPRLE